jgi:dienelactone hydrolase
MRSRDIINKRLLAAVCILFLLVMLAACGGGGGSEPEMPAPVADTCASTAILEGSSCRTFAVRIDERASTPFEEDGQPVNLEVVLFKPLAEGRYPTLVFNHGSTGDGSDPSQFGLTFISKAIAVYFVDRGWMVAFPQRRGRGQSDGLYDEGFEPDRSGYSCREDLALAGAERALDDLDAITDWIRNRTDVDTTRMLIGGWSRGGILSITYLARRPEVYRAAINFVGGWLGEGCGDFQAVNRALFVEGAQFPGTSLWLYAANDSFYSLGYSRSNFDAFTAAGGLGNIREFTRAPGLNGHFLINDPALWGEAMEDFIGQF